MSGGPLCRAELPACRGDCSAGAKGAARTSRLVPTLPGVRRPRASNNERDEQLRELSLHDVHLLLWFWRQQVSEKLESEVRITHSPSKEDLPKAYSAVLPRWEELRQQAVAEAELVAVSKFFDDDPESVFDGEALDIELNEHADSI